MNSVRFQNSGFTKDVSVVRVDHIATQSKVPPSTFYTSSELHFLDLAYNKKAQTEASADEDDDAEAPK
eukprot:CAMPEP_0172324114 /NCGR_PEP_ID=MMETSP1058-20130122/50506_1 /TAXON_ID=83371 /ORGANISM="Detonula confervacea, Strain CCMP 353" /LENGTH=67 /DNA_ID=CAMNT_0013040297 /DNA_START=166 /DNA_END=370 /DNA_ORIENTATION=-